MGCTSSCQATVTDAVDDAPLPTVGVLRCHKARWEPAQAMVGRDTNSYLFRTVHAEVDGLPYVDLRARNELTPSQLKALNEAVKALDAQGVIAITGDCGAFVHCQKEVRKLTKTPVALSSLMQAPLLASMYTQEEKAIITSTDRHTRTHAHAHTRLHCLRLGARHHQ